MTTRITISTLGYRAVAMIIWATAALAGVSAILAIDSASDISTSARPVIACLALFTIGAVAFSRRDTNLPSREEIFMWLTVLLVAAVLVAISAVYRIHDLRGLEMDVRTETLQLVATPAAGLYSGAGAVILLADTWVAVRETVPDIWGRRAARSLWDLTWDRRGQWL